MNLLTRNSEIYRQIRLLRPAIGAVIRGNIKPLIGYFRYLNLESKLKEKDFGTLSFVLYHYGFNILSQTLSRLIQERPVIIEFYNDGKFLVNHLLDYLHTGLYNEPKTFNFIKEQIKNYKVFIDVGANIGGYSIRAAKYCKVYAIEPLPRNYKILKEEGFKLRKFLDHNVLFIK